MLAFTSLMIIKGALPHSPVQAVHISGNRRKQAKQGGRVIMGLSPALDITPIHSMLALNRVRSIAKKWSARSSAAKYRAKIFYIQTA